MGGRQNGRDRTRRTTEVGWYFGNVPTSLGIKRLRSIFDVLPDYKSRLLRGAGRELFTAAEGFVENPSPRRSS